MNRVIESENLAALRTLPDASIDLIYIDPPFNTGTTQQRSRIRTIRDDAGDRTGFGGRRYRTEKIASPDPNYTDIFDDYLGFLRPRLAEAHRILTPAGSLFLHIDPREVHYVKVLLDQLFTNDTTNGRDCFQNEIIWAYDYGARSTKRWPAKHDNILWYTKDPEQYTFNLDECDRIPYMAPGLVGAT
ncbi:MAG: DNA methyltransferase, partial [Acidobacteriota bacterium]